MSKEYYKILEVSENASVDEIKKSYKRLAKVHHPDKGGDTILFQQIQTAYETLSDPQKKQQYDNPMPDIFGGGGFPGGGFPGGFPFGGGVNIFSNFMNMGGMNMGGMNGGQKKKEDEIYICKLSLKEVYYGSKKSFNVKRRYMCDSCQNTCNVCNGRGFSGAQRIQIGPMIQITNEPCKMCNTTGFMRTVQCDKCNSSGFKNKEDTFEVNIPKGVEDGKTYTYPGWGHQKTKMNEVDGDFIVKIQIENHQLFTRKNLDLLYSTEISLAETIIGKQLEIPYLNDDKITVDISKFGIINPQKDYVVVEKGLENENGHKGHLYIKFSVKYPDRSLTDEEIGLVKDIFSELNLI